MSRARSSDPARAAAPRAHALARLALTAGLWSACAQLAFAPGASADCTPDSASAVTGDAVTCTGSTGVGFEAGPGVELLEITVEAGANVQNPVAGAAAIEINANNPGDATADPPSYGVLNLGGISIDGDGSAGIRGADPSADGESNSVRNEGSIAAADGAGDDVVAIDLGDRAIVEHLGSINLFDDRNVGIRVGDDGSITVGGILNVRDADLGDGVNDIDDPIGILLGDGTAGLATVDQPRGLNVTGTVTVIGRNARGAVVGSGWSGANGEIVVAEGARLRVRGDDAIGLLVGDDSTVTIAGTVAGLGERAIAVRMGDQTIADPALRLVVTGAIVPERADAIAVSLGSKAAAPGVTLESSTSPSMQLGIMSSLVALGTPGTIFGEADGGPLIVFRSDTSDLNHLVISDGSQLVASEVLFFEPDRAVAIQGTDGAERIDNYGEIGGKVLLEGGDDFFLLGPTGTFTGDMSVNAGGGFDTLELSNRWRVPNPTNEASLDFGDYRNFERLRVDDQTTLWYGNGFSTGNTFEHVEITAGSGLIVENPLAFSGGADEFVLGGGFSGQADLGDGDDTFTLQPGAVLAAGSTIDGGAGADRVDFAADGSGQIAAFSLDPALFSAFESLHVMADARWRLDGDLGFGAPGPTLRIEDAGELVVQDPLQLGGDLAFSAGSALRIELTRDAPGAYVETSGAIDIEGTAGDGLTSTLEIEPVTTLEIGRYVLLAGASLDGAFEDVILEDTALYSFELTYDTVNHELLLDAFAQQLPYNREVTDQYVEAIDAAGPDAELQAFIDALQALSPDEYVEMLDVLHPEAYDAQTSVQLALARQFDRTLLDRPGHCIAPARSGRRDPRTKVPCRPRPLDVWTTGYGLFRTRDGAEGHTSWSDDGGGIVLGADHRQGESLLFSASLGGARAISQVEHIGKGRFTSLDVGALAAWTRGPALVQGFFSYGHGWHEAYRNVVFTGVQREARGDWQSNRLGVGGEARWTFALSGLDVSPVFEGDWARVDRPTFTEERAAPVNLRVAGAKDAVTTLRAGVELGTSILRKGYFTDFLERADGVWQPELSVKWRQVVSGDDRALESAIVGAPDGTGSTIVYSDDASQGFEIGAGVWFTPKAATRITIGARYDAFVWKDVVSHDVSGTVAFSFF